MRDIPDDETPPSKTRVKQALLELQDFGVELLELDDAQLDALPMEERLRDALADLRRIHAHGARKRQVQFVGKLLRNADLEPLRAALDARRAGRALGVKQQREVEQARERLIASDNELPRWLERGGDATRLRGLLREARRELAVGTPGRAYRDLFRELRKLLSESG